MEIGQRFKTRQGNAVTIIGKIASDSHPYLGIDEKKRIQKYTGEGFFISPSFQHKLDLVERD